MVMRGRFDFFPRGLYEPFIEVQRWSSELPGLTVEKSLALYYPYPDFFWVRKSNTLLADRLRKGMETAIEDGSFDKLFDSEFGKAIVQAKLNQRLIFTIPNTELDHIPHAGDPQYCFFERMKHDGKLNFK